MLKLPFLFVVPSLFLLLQRVEASGYGPACPFTGEAIIDTTELSLYICAGKTEVVYAGTTLTYGEVKVFVFTGYDSADSLVKVIVHKAPPVDFWAEATPVCPGQSDGVINFFNQVGPTEPYIFSVDGGQTFHEEYNYTGMPAGIYELFVKDGVGCIYPFELKIKEVPDFAIQLPFQVVACQDSVKLAFAMRQHPVPYAWEWHLPDGQPSTDTVIWAKNPGEYQLTMSDKCKTVERAVNVSFAEETPPLQIYLPNSFSPNGDGINDCFRGYAAPGLQLLDYQLTIFDRWGKKVFITEEMEGCWDGNFKEEEVVPGEYAWFISASMTGCDGGLERVFLKGGVMIVR